MRVIQFPSRRGEQVDAALIAELEAAFDGDGTGAEAEAWRELRADVRALTAPDRPRLPALPGTAAARRRRSARPSNPGGGCARWPRAMLHVAARSRCWRPSARARGDGRARRDELGASHSPSLAQSVCHVGTAHSELGPPRALPHRSQPKNRRRCRRRHARALWRRRSAGRESSGRLQQLGASISLGARGEGVQALADRVGQLAVAAGGFVESSKVELQHGSAGEATLTLKLPEREAREHAREAAAARAGARESQSLQDLSGPVQRGGRAPVGGTRRTKRAATGARESGNAAALESLQRASRRPTRDRRRGTRAASDLPQRQRGPGRSQRARRKRHARAHAGGGLTVGRGPARRGARAGRLGGRPADRARSFGAARVAARRRALVPAVGAGSA